MSDYRRVQVTWKDAQGQSGWHDIKDLKPELREITSVGFILAEKDGIIMFAGSLTDDNGAGDITHIPREWFVKIEDI